MKLLLDTSAYSNFVRSGRWTGIISQASEVLLPVPALAELRYGFACGSRSAPNERKLESFIETHLVSILGTDDSTSRHFATLRRYLRVAGTPIPINDLWIASLAVQHNLHLCADDQHFDNLPQVLRASPD